MYYLFTQLKWFKTDRSKNSFDSPSDKRHFTTHIVHYTKHSTNISFIFDRVPDIQHFFRYALPGEKNRDKFLTLAQKTNIFVRKFL